MKVIKSAEIMSESMNVAKFHWSNTQGSDALVYPEKH